MLRVLTESRIEFHRHTNSAKTFFIFSVVENLNSFADSRDFRKLIEKTVLGAVLVELHALNNLTVERTKTHRRTGRGGEGGEGGCSPPKFWATQIFWAARENLGKASFLRRFRVF